MAQTALLASVPPIEKAAERLRRPFRVVRRPHVLCVGPEDAVALRNHVGQAVVIKHKAPRPTQSEDPVGVGPRNAYRAPLLKEIGPDVEAELEDELVRPFKRLTQLFR